MDKKRLGNIFLIVFIDLFGFGLILPLLPYIGVEYGASPGLIGLISASYPAAQMLGAPILGSLSDKYGRRPILLISILGTAIGYVILGLSNAIWMLFLSRIIDGLTGGNISVAQAYITDITDEKDRAKGLGLIGAAFGLGFIFGPAIGGIISQNFGFSATAYVAVALSMISWLGVLFWLPESLTEEVRATLSNRPARKLINFRELFEAMKRPVVGPLLVIRLGQGLAFNTFQTIFSLYALERFNLNAGQTGGILAYIGVLIVFVQGVAIGPMTKRFPENKLLMAALIALGVGLLGYGLAPTLWILIIAMIPMSFGAGVFNTTINSILTKKVTPEEVGGMLGISSSIESSTRVISPAASGFLLGISPTIPGVVGAIIIALLLPIAWRSLSSPNML